MERSKIRTAVEKYVSRLSKDALLSPTLAADVRKAVAPKIGLAPNALLSYDRIAYRAAGIANPLPGKTEKAVATALRKRRDAAKGRVRWETLAGSATAALGREVSPAEARRLYVLAGGKVEKSYAGKGTKVALDDATYDRLAAK